MEILGNGRLIVDGGDGTKHSVVIAARGGGAGGIIQIISPVGNLSAERLSVGHGTSSDKVACDENPTKANGYYYLQGKSIQWSVMRLDCFLISSSAVPSISERGYFHTHIESDTMIR